MRIQIPIFSKSKVLFYTKILNILIIHSRFFINRETSLIIMRFKNLNFHNWINFQITRKNITVELDWKIQWKFVRKVPTHDNYNILIWYLYNKTRHSYIYVAYTRPNSWIEWAESFWGQSGVAGGWFRLKKIYFFLFSNFFFSGNAGLFS